MGHDPQLRETESTRLDSWKEIASFLHRDARTVRRWERERRLPVHRVPGGERSGVFAYVAELERWLHAASPVASAAESRQTASVSEDVSLVPDVIAGEAEVSSAISTEGTAPLGTNSTQDSAFQSLNSFEIDFAAGAVAEDEYTSATPRIAARLHASSHARFYQVISLFLLLMAAIGISAAVVHYRETKPVEAVVHQPNPEAQDLYLRGRYYWNLRTEEGLNRAVDLFTQSIVEDPHYSEAYAGLADAYLLLRQYGHMPNSEAFPRALAAARRAIALDDASPEAHRSIAFVLRFWNWDMVAAEKEYRRAIELNPKDSLSHHWYATALLSAGRYREAMTQIDIARSLEPQSVSVLADRGLILSMTDVQAGVLALQHVEQAQPGFASTHMYLASAYLRMEDYENFLAESRLAAEGSHTAEMISAFDSAQKTLAKRGPKPMLRQLAGDLAPLADRGGTPAYDTARLFGLAGESKQAMRYLRMACDRREPGFLNIEDEQAFTELRSSEEYSRLISRREVSSGSSRQPIARLEDPKLSQ